MSNDAAVLARIMERMERTLRYCEGRSCEDFERDLMLQEACVFNVLQIGELTKKGLSDAFIQAHPSGGRCTACATASFTATRASC